MEILVINSGSSSIKYKLYQMPEEKILSKGSIEHIGEKGSSVKDHYSGLKKILKGLNNVFCVGHRVVHGAERFKRPCFIDKRVIKSIRHCSRFAPLHNPANLQGILACKKLLPRIKQVAVFDTAFHQTLPRYAYIYGLPLRYYKNFGIRKYGFHGTSHEYVAKRAAEKLDRPLNKLKLITCHLGNGCSISAIKFGKSIDTSMGFTPLEGLVMGTRCGDIDPALVTYIMQKERLNIKEMENILNSKSGLLGISGISNDMRILRKKASQGNDEARLAREVFVYRVRKYISAYIGLIGQVDAVVFTAGIGENQAQVRNQITRGLFAHFKKRPAVLVISTDEELMIARQSYLLIKNG